jgi:small-conductance mechanosensitive channel
MSGITGQPWFWPALTVVIGLPLALLILHELHGALVRRDSAYAKPVLLLRNWVFPVFAVYLLVNQLEYSNVHATWSKISATVFGFLVILLLLSSANAALFGEARSGTWRDRLPSIFIDLGQFILIIIGIGLLLSWVWGANVGGLVTAVGVTSVVIGLAVQGAVGPVIAGLLLLFEQPFRLGDWLETPTVRGRVVEVNWRAIHIDTANGIQVVPNATLAAGSFTNLSRVTGPAFNSIAIIKFAAADPPGVIVKALLSVAEALPAKLADLPPRVVPLGTGQYKVYVPVASPADDFSTRTLLLHRAWYAAQRAGVHIDRAILKPTQHYVESELRSVGEQLGLESAAVETMVASGRLLLFAEGEIIQAMNTIPSSMGFITEGAVGMFVRTEDGRQLDLGQLGVGDFLGATALTRQRMITGAVALSDVSIVAVSRKAMDAVVQQDPRLARLIGDSIEMRRRAAREALAEAAQGIL